MLTLYHQYIGEHPPVSSHWVTRLLDDHERFNGNTTANGLKRVWNGKPWCTSAASAWTGSRTSIGLRVALAGL